MGLIATFLYLPAMSGVGATAMSRVVAGKVCYRAAPKLTSTADMRRIADRPPLAAAFGIRKARADVTLSIEGNTLPSVRSITTAGTWKSAARAGAVIDAIAFALLAATRSRPKPCSTVACLLNSAASVALCREVKATPLTMSPTTNSSPIAQTWAKRTSTSRPPPLNWSKMDLRGDKSRLRLARIHLAICGLSFEVIMCHTQLICQQARSWSCSR